MNKFILFFIFVFSVITFDANATDNYNPVSNHLSIPAVVLGDKVYRDVVITIDEVLSIGGSNAISNYTAKPSDSFDYYDSDRNQLTIPNVNAYGNLYYDVVVRVGVVLAVGSSSKATLLESASANPSLLKSFVLSDPSSSYKDQCLNPTIQFVIPVKLNDEKLQDFIVHYWCPGNLGKEVTTATPDALVAFVSQSDGTYKIDNERVFGSTLYRLGGASRKYVRGDINGDGRDDFAFAMNWEDGRSGAIAISNATEPSVLMSISDGSYRVTRLGKPNWNHSVEIVKNSSSVDVVFGGFVRDLQAFRFINGSFSDISTEYVNQYAGSWGTSFRAIPDASTGITQQFAGTASRQATNVNGWAASEQGIQILNKLSSNWTLVKEYWQKVDFIVNWISWQLTSGLQAVKTINGKQYFGGAYDEMCIMPALQKGGSRLLLAKMGAAQDTKGRNLIAGQTYSEQETTPVNFYNFFALDATGNLNPIPSPIINEESQSNFNFFDCKDVNNDGLPDLVSYAFTRPGFYERIADGGKPTIYLNNGKGQLVRKDIGNLPKYSGGNELQSTMADVNGDGISDLILFGSTTHQGGGNIQIHLLRSNLQLTN